jgi:hypothetical protein
MGNLQVALEHAGLAQVLLGVPILLQATNPSRSGTSVQCPGRFLRMLQEATAKTRNRDLHAHIELNFSEEKADGVRQPAHVNLSMRGTNYLSTRQQTCKSLAASWPPTATGPSAQG